MPVHELVTARKWGWCRRRLGHSISLPESVEEWRWCHEFGHARHRCLGFVQQFQA
jgi:hypothetical protein